jgi:hypothetical protein
MVAIASASRSRRSRAARRLRRPQPSAQIFTRTQLLRDSARLQLWPPRSTPESCHGAARRLPDRHGPTASHQRPCAAAAQRGTTAALDGGDHLEISIYQRAFDLMPNAETAVVPNTRCTAIGGPNPATARSAMICLEVRDAPRLAIRRPIYRGWLRCSSVECAAHTSSSRRASRAPRGPARQTNLAPHPKSWSHPAPLRIPPR